MNLSASYYYPTDSPLHEICDKYHEWDGKYNVWKEVTRVFPKEGLRGLIWSSVEDTCIALMHFEILKHLLDGHTPLWSFPGRNINVLFAVYATNPAKNPQSGLCKGLLRYREPGAELICLGKEDACGETWVQGTYSSTSTQSPQCPNTTCHLHEQDT